jgi:hypothetical protein
MSHFSYTHNISAFNSYRFEFVLFIAPHRHNTTPLPFGHFFCIFIRSTFSFLLNKENVSMRNIFITSVNLCLAKRFILFAVLVSLFAISDVCLLVSNAISSQKSENHGLQPDDNHYYIAVDSDAKTHRLSKLKLKTTVGIGASLDGSFDASISKFGSKLSATDNSSMQFSVTEHLMTYLSYDEIKSQYSNCETPPKKTTFFDTDSFATLWFSFQNAVEGDTFKVKWYAPSGTLYYTGAATIEYSYQYSYSWMASWIYIKRYPAASKLGKWQVKVFRNDSLLFTENFKIRKKRKKITSAATQMPTSTSTEASIPAAIPMIPKHGVISRGRRIIQFTDKTEHRGRRP